jgi:GT2 family glycosyltransferase
MTPHRGPTETEDIDGEAGDRSLVTALGWMAGRLAATVGEPEGPRPIEHSWGRDASSYPPDYWHWMHLRHQYQIEHADELSPVELPTTGPLLSIVVPVYRPPIWLFHECVLSVLAQSYQNWELCLCDDGSDDPALAEALDHLASADVRIKVMALDQNVGISRATNRALEAASGEFVVLLDHDDVLAADALAEIAAVVAAQDDVDVVYSDEDKLDELDRPFQPHFKPDWDPDLLLAYPYLGHVTVIRTELLRRIGGFRPEFDGSQDYDVMLRATEVARRIVHIPKVLYHWRVVAGSAAGDTEAKPWAHLASRRALEDALDRRGIAAVVEVGPFRGAYHVRRKILDSPTVSVIIPFRDQAALTVACLESLDRDPGYEISDVVLVDNGSTEPETRALRQRLERRPGTRILDYPGEFNWAAINNFAAATCQTDMLLFLNNDIEATSPGWMHALVELGQRPEVGAVGARLVYPDGKLQHAGVVLGMGGVASHIFIGMPKGVRGYFSWDGVVRGYSAVTAACMLVRRSVFEELGGFDEVFAVAFNDVDFCIRLGRAGYRLLYTPHAELTHYESVSRGLSGYARDYQAFLPRWMDHLVQGDPSYNPNLGRLQPWCPLRAPEEDEEWLSLVTGLIEKVSSEGGAGDSSLGAVPELRSGSEPGSPPTTGLGLAPSPAVEVRA